MTEFARTALGAVGSLRFAAVVLMLLLVSMACATLYESMHGTEQALAACYRSWWFALLLVLLAAGVAAALVLRYPFSRSRIGFVLTHGAILLTLAGAAVTRFAGVEGQVAVGEGQTVDQFAVPGDTLTLTNRVSGERFSVDLTAAGIGGLVAADRPASPALVADKLRIEIARYVPDSVSSQRMLDDNPREQPAVEVALSSTGLDGAVWLLPGRPAQTGGLAAAFRPIADATEWARLVHDQPQTSPGSKGTVVVEINGGVHRIALEDCMEHAAVLPGTDGNCTVLVLRYLPHATVGSDNQIVNLSDRPVNPYIEVDLRLPSGGGHWSVFARFPDFGDAHSEKTAEGPTVRFEAQIEDLPATPIEVVTGPDGSLYARFCADGSKVVCAPLVVGTPVETPWPGMKLGALRRFEHARMDWSVVPVEGAGKRRVPALLLALSTPEHEAQMWVQKGRGYPLSVDGTPYEVIYSDRAVPLGFSLTLSEFRVGRYPGSASPRSFESHVRFSDPATGLSLNRVIRMNAPSKFGRYRLFQSSYVQDSAGSTSVLSVSRDPGQPIVFAGYVIMTVGMIIVLGTRLGVRKSCGPEIA